MKNLLIKQAKFLPLIYFGSIVLASLFAVDYSQVGQHASELALNENKLTAKLFNTGMFITGISLLIFSVGLILVFKKQFLITATLIAIFGATYIVASFVPIGSRWHDLYAIGISLTMLPFAFLSEESEYRLSRYTKTISIVCSVIIFTYLWCVINRFDPMEYRGLTQRVFGITVFSFLSYIAFHLSSILNAENGVKN